jgi:hypothetical protein
MRNQSSSSTSNDKRKASIPAWQEITARKAFGASYHTMADSYTRRNSNITTPVMMCPHWAS